MPVKVYKRNYDCVDYGKCLAEKAMKGLPLQCSTCRRYRSNPLTVDEFVMLNKEDTTIYTPILDETDYKYMSLIA